MLLNDNDTFEGKKGDFQHDEHVSPDHSVVPPVAVLSQDPVQSGFEKSTMRKIDMRLIPVLGM